jgi:hypothetical protein
MNVEDLETVIELWRVERVTEQQAIGKILLLLREVKAQVEEIEERLRRLERDMAVNNDHRINHE